MPGFEFASGPLAKYQLMVKTRLLVVWRARKTYNKCTES